MPDARAVMLAAPRRLQHGFGADGRLPHRAGHVGDVCADDRAEDSVEAVRDRLLAPAARFPGELAQPFFQPPPAGVVPQLRARGRAALGDLGHQPLDLAQDSLILPAVDAAHLLRSLPRETLCRRFVRQRPARPVVVTRHLRQLPRRLPHPHGRS